MSLGSVLSLAALSGRRPHPGTWNLNINRCSVPVPALQGSSADLKRTRVPTLPHYIRVLESFSSSFCALMFRGLVFQAVTLRFIRH